MFPYDLVHRCLLISRTRWRKTTVPAETARHSGRLGRRLERRPLRRNAWERDGAAFASNGWSLVTRVGRWRSRRGDLGDTTSRVDTLKTTAPEGEVPGPKCFNSKRPWKSEAILNNRKGCIAFQPAFFQRLSFDFWGCSCFFGLVGKHHYDYVIIYTVITIHGTGILTQEFVIKIKYGCIG